MSESGFLQGKRSDFPFVYFSRTVGLPRTPRKEQDNRFYSRRNFLQVGSWSAHYTWEVAHRLRRLRPRFPGGPRRAPRLYPG